MAFALLTSPKAGQVPGKKRSEPGTRTAADEQAARKNYEAKRQRKFLPKWKDEFLWLKHDEDIGEMYCDVCRKHPELADKGSSMVIGNSVLRYDTLKPHESSMRHLRCDATERKKVLGAALPTPNVVQGLQKMDANFKDSMTNIMHAAYYVAKMEVPFAHFAHIHRLIRRVGGKLPACYDNDKACSRFIVDIYEERREKLLEKLSKAKYYSIMIDGVTDSATLENELVYVRFLSKEGPVNSYLGIQDVKHANAQGVLAAIDKAFLESSIVDWKSKLVGFGSDGAAVNLGVRNGVAAQLKRNVSHLISIHCIAHRLELGVVSAIKENHQLECLQYTLKFLYDQYHYSPKALRELRMIATSLEEKILKPTTLRGARWLPYIHRATKIVCESFGVLVSHFEHMANPDRCPKPSPAVAGRAKKVLKYLHSYDDVMFMQFMCDVLDHLAELSKAMQKNSLTVCQAIDSQERCYWNLISLQTEVGPQMQRFLQSVAQSGKYMGITMKSSSSTLQAVRKAITDSIISHIEERLHDLQKDSILSKFHVLDPSCWPK